MKTLVDWDGCWKVFVVCKEKNIFSNLARADVRACQSIIDKQHIQTSFIALINMAHTGLPFSDLYDEKKCHVAHTFTRNHREEKIWRIWGAGTTRIYFIYLPERRIIILKAKAKRTDKLSSGELLELEGICGEVLDCTENYDFKSREIK